METKEELLKSINQIIVIIQNIELEIGNDPELCRALTKQRYAEENFKSKLLVAKRHAFTKLRTRILHYETFESLRRKEVFRQPIEQNVSILATGVSFVPGLRKLFLFRQGVAENVGKSVQNVVVFYGQIIGAKKAMDKWRFFSSKRGICWLSTKYPRLKILAAKAHKRASY